MGAVPCRAAYLGPHVGPSRTPIYQLPHYGRKWVYDLSMHAWPGRTSTPLVGRRKVRLQSPDPSFKISRQGVGQYYYNGRAGGGIGAKGGGQAEPRTATPQRAYMRVQNETCPLYFVLHYIHLSLFVAIHSPHHIGRICRLEECARVPSREKSDDISFP